MTKWFHKCDLNWLKARQKCLTATDVKSLLPVTRTGRKRTVSDSDYLKILASKMVNLTEDDCISTGAAARGHILEPYAIDRYNEEDFGVNEWLYHWDDMVITKINHKAFGLAFSPDAMNDINPWPTENMISIGTSFNPTVIGEVKSYSPERHMVCGFTPKDELEERWQLATAMAVCSTITTAYLLFYNPSMRNQLYIVDYSREDLEEEIEMVLDVEKDWLTWLGNLGKLDTHYLVNGKPEEEQVIINNIVKAEELNPESERSVII